LAGWINQQQLEVTDYLREENRTLRQLAGNRRLRLTDLQRRRLADDVADSTEKPWRGSSLAGF
jgi:hypothetical protein